MYRATIYTRKPDDRSDMERCILVRDFAGPLRQVLIDTLNGVRPADQEIGPEHLFVDVVELDQRAVGPPDWFVDVKIDRGPEDCHVNHIEKLRETILAFMLDWLKDAGASGRLIGLADINFEIVEIYGASARTVAREVYALWPQLQESSCCIGPGPYAA